MTQFKRYAVYIVAVIIGVAMIIISLATPEWPIEKQIALFGQLVAVIAGVLAAMNSNPNKVITVRPEDLVLSQDTPLTEADVFNQDTAGEIIEGPTSEALLERL